MRLIARLLEHPMPILAPLAVFAGTLVVAYALVRLVRRLLRTWSERSGSRPVLILAESVSGSLVLWAVMLAVNMAMETSDLPERYERWGARTLLVLLVLSLTVMLARLAGSLIRHYGSEIPSALPVTTLTQNLVQLAVVILGILVLLSQLGFSVTPILTFLGAGGLAVALALQETLSNLFAGFYVSIAGHVRLADYIKLNTGEEGYVTDIGWRSTTIRALPNNLIIVPNSKLAQAIVTNYCLPEKRMGTSVTVTVGYGAEVEQVEALLHEVASSIVAEVPEILADPAPSVMFDPGYGESGLGFTLNFQVRDFVSQYMARHQLRKRVYRKLKEAGLQVPYPVRTVLLHHADEGSRTGVKSED